VSGDDVRLIHWLSSARARKLLARQHLDEQGPVFNVVLDLGQRSYHRDEDVELGFDVAASLLTGAVRGGMSACLKATNGYTCAWTPGKSSVARVSATLTRIRVARDAGAAELASAFGDFTRRVSRQGLLTVITGAVEPALPRVPLNRRPLPPIVVVRIGAVESGQEDGPVAVDYGVPATVVHAADAETAVSVWSTVCRTLARPVGHAA
jgi:uncharacterized protein (DUF58 family)